jgi:hypothetical protein
VPFPAANIEMDLGGATARMHLESYAIPDFFDLKHGLTGGPSVPARVTFETRWSGVIKRGPRIDEGLRFAGDFVFGNATTAWTAQEEGFAFASDPIETSHSLGAVIGRERNGMFAARSITAPGGPLYVRRLGDG